MGASIFLRGKNNIGGQFGYALFAEVGGVEYQITSVLYRPADPRRHGYLQEGEVALMRMDGTNQEYRLLVGAPGGTQYRTASFISLRGNPPPTGEIAVVREFLGSETNALAARMGDGSWRRILT